MKHTSSMFMSRLIFVSMVAAALVSWSGTAAHAQGVVTSSLSGVVLDSGGGVIPGASVIVTDDATGTKFEAVTTSTGAFSLPALNPGAYTVTVSLAGFKTAVVKGVRLLPAQPRDIKVTLQVGNLEETVTVQGVSELVQTRSATIASTVNVDSINMLPLPTRNAINFIALLPGVNTTGANRDSNFLGLPDSATAITLDGVNNNENFNKSTEGLFAMVTPRQDAVEAVTVTTAVPGSDSGGHGGVTIAFVTRSGTDKFAGSLYEYWRNPVLNTNYYFNLLKGLPKNQVKINQYGFRQGGPVVIPRLYDGHGKAFFFFNYEEFRMPTSFSRTRTILTPDAQTGIFKWGSRQVNLYDLAATKGQTPTPDPMVASVLNAIRAATQKAGTVNATSDPNTMTFDFLSPGVQPEKQATARFDYNLGAKHRVTGTWTHQSIDRNPDMLNGTDARFPGAPNLRRYLSFRNIVSGALRSVFRGNLVNELRGGLKWGPSFFGKVEWNGPETFADQGGRALALTNISGTTLTSWHTTNSPSSRSAWSWNLDETLNWQRASHSLKFGGSYYEGHVWVENQTMVPAISFGVNDNDPAANAMFTTANFPGASSTQLGYARNLYALLTGRVTTISADARLDENTGQYKLLGPRTQRLIQHEYGLFAQDVWRVNPKLTLNAGLRWDLQLPIEPTNSIMSTSTLADLCGMSGVGSQYGCNLYQPGASGGVKPTFVEYQKGSYGYRTDWNNVSPNIGFAWRPSVKSGFGRTILGDPEQATFRAGYSIAYSREGMALFTGVIGGNPGSTINVIRSPDLGNLVNPGETWPVLLRDASRLATPSFASSPVYPIAATRADNIRIFDPAIEVARVRSVTVGFQRALTKDMAFEIRYNGTWGGDLWNNQNYNEVNIIENGFFNEFKLAQQNLQANLDAGRGSTFKYSGPGTGTSPLPAILAYFQGLPAAQASDASKYTSSLFKSSTYLTSLAKYNPQPGTLASSLFGDATRRANALAAGLPANFFVVNPDVGGAYIYKSNGFTIYNALQLEVRQRMSAGLQFTANYQYAKSYNSRNLGQRYGLVSQLNTNVPPHALKLLWNYALPFGRDKRFGSNMSRWLDAIAGGWEFHGAGRIQSFWVDFGNYRLVGMTLQDLQNAFKLRIGPDPTTGVTTVWMLPDDIILNTRRAFNTDPTSATGYSSVGVPQGRYLAPANGPDCIQLRAGDCAPLNNYVRGLIFKRFDMSVAKRFTLKGRTNFELRVDAINVFNNINFNEPDDLVGSAATIGQVTEGYRDTSNTFDPGGRLVQLVVRFNW